MSTQISPAPTDEEAVAIAAALLPAPVLQYIREKGLYR